MYLGKLVEVASTGELYAAPAHPYTRALLDSVLPLHPARGERKPAVTGEVPSARNPPSGCRFHPRCPHAQAICSETAPELRRIDQTERVVACHFAERVVASGAPVPTHP